MSTAPCFIKWLNSQLAALLFRTFFMAAKTSLLALPTMRTIIPPSCHVFPLLLLVVALLVIFTLFFMAHYLKNDLQLIFRNVLDSKPPSALAPALVVAQQHKGPCKMFLKAWFPDIYWNKTNMNCYNFFL